MEFALHPALRTLPPPALFYNPTGVINGVTTLYAPNRGGVTVPKINVYLPDDLAEAVREMGVPVSAICQRALEASVRQVTAIRQATLGGLNPDDPAGRMSHFTTRARSAVALGLRGARAAGSPYVGTEHLLAGVLAEGGNLAIEVLRAMEIEPDALRHDLDRAVASRSAVDGAVDDIVQARREAQQPAQEQEPGEAEEPGVRFSGPAANALELAVTEAIGLGHNYVGCEHLLLGLVSEPEGTAGQVLCGLGAEYRPTRRAISAALVGYTYMQGQVQGQVQPNETGKTAPAGMAQALGEAIRRELQPFAERLGRLEQRLGRTSD